MPEPARLDVPDGEAHGRLVLRPWQAEDLAGLVEALRPDLGPNVRRRSSWLESAPADEAQAREWLSGQDQGWLDGHWTSFAVLEDGVVVGNVAIKGEPEPSPLGSTDSAEVSYWTAADARGRGIATAAVRVVTEWVAEKAAGRRPFALRAVHDETNVASCRVAERAGYGLAEISPAAPPRWLHSAHIHVLQLPGPGRPGEESV